MTQKWLGKTDPKVTSQLGRFGSHKGSARMARLAGVWNCIVSVFDIAKFRAWKFGEERSLSLSLQNLRDFASDLVFGLWKMAIPYRTNPYPQEVLDGMPPTKLQLLRSERVLLMLWKKGSGALGEVKSSCRPLGGAPWRTLWKCWPITRRDRVVTFLRAYNGILLFMKYKECPRDYQSCRHVSKCVMTFLEQSRGIFLAGVSSCPSLWFPLTHQAMETVTKTQTGPQHNCSWKCDISRVLWSLATCNILHKRDLCLPFSMQNTSFCTSIFVLCHRRSAVICDTLTLIAGLLYIASPQTTPKFSRKFLASWGSPRALNIKASQPNFLHFPRFRVRIFCVFRVFALCNLLRPLFSGVRLTFRMFHIFPIPSSNRWFRNPTDWLYFDQPQVTGISTALSFGSEHQMPKPLLVLVWGYAPLFLVFLPGGRVFLRRLSPTLRSQHQLRIKRLTITLWSSWQAREITWWEPLGSQGLWNRGFRLMFGLPLIPYMRQWRWGFIGEHRVDQLVSPYQHLPFSPKRSKSKDYQKLEFSIFFDISE